jgi:hypothetical protein
MKVLIYINSKLNKGKDIFSRKLIKVFLLLNELLKTFKKQFLKLQIH